LLGGATGVEPCNVLVIGGGIVGINAARIALGLGANFTILDRSEQRLAELTEILGTQVTALQSTAEIINEQITNSDLIVGAVLIPGGKASKLITRDMLEIMRPGTIIADVAIDQGGCCETSRPTTHADPVYEIDGIVHYCVANIPGAVPVTASAALNNATLPFIEKLANMGIVPALLDDPHLLAGLNVRSGKLTREEVANDLALEFTAPMQTLSE